MAVRKRFSATEKPLIVAGTEVEWQHGAHWYPGVILGPIVTVDGWQQAPMHNLATSRTISPGDTFTASPGKIRARKI
jgi:hypothetical protein